MAKKLFLSLGLLVIFPAFVLMAAEKTEVSNPGLLHSLEANRSLLDEYQKEYIRVKAASLSPPSDLTKRKLSALEDKIKTLEEDSEELQSFLPVGRQAAELISGLMTKKAMDEKLKETEAAQNLLNESALKHNLLATSQEAESTYRLHERALALVSQKKFKEALAVYEEIVLKNPDDDQAYVIMGHSYILTGQYQKAERAFGNAVHIDPQNINEIAPFYENMVLQDPDDDMAFANLGYAYLILGDLAKAKNAFAEALHINPDNRPSQGGLQYIERLTTAA